MDPFATALDDAITEYEKRRSIRLVEELRYQKAKELANKGSWHDALRILRPLWHTMTYRKEGWWDIVEDIGSMLHHVAEQVGDGASILYVQWELMSCVFPERNGRTIDLQNSLTNITTITQKPILVIRDEEVQSFLTATFAFRNAENKVADSCICQLTVNSAASSTTLPVVLSEIKIHFLSGSIPIVISHASNHTNGVSQFERISLVPKGLTDTNDADELPEPGDLEYGRLSGHADLSLAPGQRRVFELAIPVREPGQLKATSAKMSFLSAQFDLRYIVNLESSTNAEVWWVQDGLRKRLVRTDTHVTTILPKPPKMDLRPVDLREQYYTNEATRILFDIFNGEEEHCMTDVRGQILGEGSPAVGIASYGSEETASHDTVYPLGPSEISVGSVAKASSVKIMVNIDAFELSASYDLVVDLSYHLASDSQTLVTRSMSFKLFVISPFEANYDFTPRLNQRPWPSFFEHNMTDRVDSEDQGNTQAAAGGLSQSWCLTARYASFATDPITVLRVSAEVLNINGGIACHMQHLEDAKMIPNNGRVMLFKTISETQIEVLAQKLSLDDPRSASLDLTLVISWRRNPNAPVNTTKLLIPRLNVASSEPRVLLTSVPTMLDTLPVLILSYTIENPSLHFLTFGIAMQPSEDFAFSGPKAASIQALPLSRRTATFRIIPKNTGIWLRPVLIVKDQYFQKILKIIPCEGCTFDQDGPAIWVPDEDNGSD